MHTPPHTFEELLAELEKQIRAAASTRNIPGEVRRALHAAVDALLNAQSTWAEAEPKSP